MSTAEQLALFAEPVAARRELELAQVLRRSERWLLATAVALGAGEVRDWSAAETDLTRDLPAVPPAWVTAARWGILTGDDPLGDAFCGIRSPAERRKRGATYTPTEIVQVILDWAARFPEPERVVDPGTGSGRFLLEAAHRFPNARLVGIELDPVAAILARANLAAAGLGSRARVLVRDYCAVNLEPAAGRTLFIGNPPYVRHHLIGPDRKRWLTERARAMGLEVSQLAGLHAHFLMATAVAARPGDYGGFITAAEWLDVNYGKLVRDLFLSALGGQRLDVLEPHALPFADAATTGAITYFVVGSRPPAIEVRRAESVEALQGPESVHLVRRERLEAERRWSELTRPSRAAPEGYIELGELCRVHRGQVTGLNRVWIAGPHSKGLPESLLFPSVTRARELFEAGTALETPNALRRVIDLPADLGILDSADRRAVGRFLELARRLGADQGYVATNRKAWWSVGLREPAPILTTYMARRPPAFVRNLADARHINIAHGIYPREPLSETALSRLARYLASGVQLRDGRTYAGGLTKFEPRELERVLVPAPGLLERGWE